MKMKALTVVLLTLALAVPAAAQVPAMWDRPVGECTHPDGRVVADPGIIPLPCDPLEYCVAWDAAEECVETGEYVIPGCTALNDSPEYAAAVEMWVADKWNWNWCVLIDYFVFIGGLGY